MAKQKKRGFFSWLGFGEKEQQPEQKTEDRQGIEEQQLPETPVETAADVEAEAPAHDKQETEAFAERLVEVTEQVQESEKPQPVTAERQAEETEILDAPPVAAWPEEPAAAEAVSTVDAPQPAPEAEVEPTETLAVEAAADLADEEEEAPAAEAAQAQETVAHLADDEAEAPQREQEKPTKEGFFARLKRSLLKTKENLGSGFISLFRGKKIDDDLFEELEEQLLIADVGVETTRKIVANLTESASRKQLKDAEALYGLMKEEMGEILAKVDAPLNVEGRTPFVILMVGVNGVGKTTTIGKLARQFEQQGKSVMLAAGDTFRAAAVEQLQVWGERNAIPVIAQHTGADSASVIFDAIQAAKVRGIDVLIADTAGRLQNKAHLMEELKKIVRVMKKLDEDAPHEIMLTIDASTGQNAISQAKLFHEAVGLTGITLTKLDGTAKGGVIFSVADRFGIPIRYIGVGERIEDLRPFKADDFIEALFARED
ncbi:signal recognition particle-docking protein FtsY [Intestinirhabdus alba]|uniref:Signal recognition particle receptor FtsY n=1 Tax=Intestinirhabdus alba TaxID=2899544 RepID=A0A6L6IHN4_9ENTR|nr:signal recognition particle-docking protein FtsY [Intestinirhabdus alba]MTH45417.1 signal recognition particle-docking protein FtsY [Intestinirhabdus alba]